MSMTEAGAELGIGSTALIHPVCFSGRRGSAGKNFYASLPVSPSHVPGDACVQWELSDQCVEAFARLIPILACGEESAIHVFSGAAALAMSESPASSNANGCAMPSVSARALTDIATDEMRHEAWLAAWRAKLPDCLDPATRRQARRFFARQASDDPALHFIRIAALDSAVCQILAPLITYETPLFGVTEIRITLNRIRTDEARHVRISRACAATWGATPEQIRAEWQSIRFQLATLLESVEPDLATLGTDTEKLFGLLKRLPDFPVTGSK